MKKRLMCVFLTSTMLLGNLPVYAQGGGSLQFSEEGLVAEEGVSAQALEVVKPTEDEALEVSPAAEIEDEETSSSAVEAFATDTGYMELTEWDGDVQYTLTVYTEYELNGELCCQVTNISKDVVCKVEVPEYIMVGEEKRYVRSISKNAFETAKFTAVTLPESIREIGEKAFYNCTRMETLNVNGKLIAQESVPQTDADGNPVYDENGELVYVQQNIASNLDERNCTVKTTIGNDAFSGCIALKEANISGMRTMGDNLFKGCVSLKKVTFSTDGMYEVSYNNVSQKELAMTLGKNAFEGCSGLEEISIPKNMTTLGSNAFINCTSLKTVNVGPSIYSSSINLESFTGCTAMENIYVDETNTNMCSIDGMLYYGRPESPSALEYCPPCNATTILDLPSSVTSINDKVFMGNNVLKQLIISVKYDSEGNPINASRIVNINASAFEGCTSIQSVEFQVSVNVGVSAFKGCTSLQRVANSYNGSTIGSSAFQDCTALKVLDFYGWRSISNAAFAGCTALETVVAGEGMGHVSDRCFEGCTSLKEVDLSNMYYNVAGSNSTTKFNFGAYIFKDCTQLQKVALPRTLLGLSTGTFQNCESLVTVTSGEDLGYIASLAFDNCPSLVNPPSPRFLVRIQYNAFGGCTALKDYPLTRSVIYIENGAFTGCPNLNIMAPEGSEAIAYAEANSISYEYTVDDIQDREFLIKDSSGNISGYRGGFKSLTIPDDFFEEGDAKGLGDSRQSWIGAALAGSNCTVTNYLKEINLGPVEKLYSGTLASASIETITMPNIKTIYSRALSGCRYLKEVTIPASCETIAGYAFSGCNFLINVTFEEGEGTIAFEEPSTGADATNIFENCLGLTNLTLSERVNKIPNYCFSGCSSLLAFNSSEAITEIGQYAFRNCTSLNELKLSSLTREIGVRAFENCKSLKLVTLEHNTFLEKEAFYGCTGIERIIIPQTVNVAISNTPFVSTNKATVVCVENSKGEEYAKAFNDPETYASLFGGLSTAEQYIGAYEYTIEYGRFVEGLTHTTVQSQILIPDGVTVKRGSEVLASGDYVMGGDVLTFTVAPSSQGLAPYMYINGKFFDHELEYTVPDNIPVSIDLEYRELKGKLTIPEGVKVFRNGTELTDGIYVKIDDVLTFELDKSDISIIPTLYINGTAVDDTAEYVVPEDVDVLLTIDRAERMGKLTIPDNVRVFKNGVKLESGTYVETGDRLTFEVDAINGQTGQLYINGSFINANATYAVPSGIHLVFSTVYPDLKGLVTISEGVTVYKNGNEMVSGSYAAEGDVLTFVIADDYKDGRFYINGKEADPAAAYTVPGDTDIEIKVSNLKFLYGDANCDNILGAKDSVNILQKVLDNSFITELEKNGGDAGFYLDVNADEVLGAQDAAYVLQKVLDNSFMMPCEKE